MGDFSAASHSALDLITSGDPHLFDIVVLSLQVSVSAVVIAAVIGLPMGAALAVSRFPGRRALVVVTNSLMGLPPVAVGLIVYLLLSRAGPLGDFGLLFTPRAMVIAQAVLVLPIVVALTRQAAEDAWTDYHELLNSLGAGQLQASVTLLWDIRFSLVTTVLAGFGRAAAEVRIATGHVRSLAHLRRGDADVVFVHDRSAEEAFVAEGAGVDRRDVMYNDFVLIGPKADPAHVAGGKDITVALKAIMVAQAPFVSRGDRSGTHAAELKLWADAGIDIATSKGAWYRETGSGMGASLNTASAMDAYLLSDRGTWLAFKNRGDLVILVEGDKRLFNQYGVIMINPARFPQVKRADARAFIDWLVSPDGQAAIASYQIDGQQLFFPNASP